MQKACAGVRLSGQVGHKINNDYIYVAYFTSLGEICSCFFELCLCRLNDICGGSLHNEGGRRAKSSKKGAKWEQGVSMQESSTGQIRWFDAVACGGACGAGAVASAPGLVVSLGLSPLFGECEKCSRQCTKKKHKRQKTEGG